MKIQFIEVPEIYGNVCGEKILIQSKCDKNSEKGRESVEFLEGQGFFSV